MILGMMSGRNGLAGEAWFFGPVAQNGAAGGSEAFYLRTSDPTNWAVGLRPLPAPVTTLRRITSANGAIFFIENSTNQAVSFNGGSSWTACSGMSADDELDVFWNGNFYYHSTRRSADGVNWEAIPNLPANTTVRLARQSDGLIVGWQSNTGYQVSTDDGASWTLRTGYGTSQPNTMATNGERISFNISNTQGRYSDNQMASSTSSGDEVQYSAYCDGVNFVCKANAPGVRELGTDAIQGAITLPVDTNARSDANIFGAPGAFVAALYVTGTPVETTVYVSDDGGITWDNVATLYGGSANIASTAQRP